MDDKDVLLFWGVLFFCSVQIPLWTIRTEVTPGNSRHRRQVQIPLWTIRTWFTPGGSSLFNSSDSSMDDKDGVKMRTYKGYEVVQIPLWTIRTNNVGLIKLLPIFVQIPLWTIRTLCSFFILYHGTCSDSSMDDKDRDYRPGEPHPIRWFRFLYGR